MFLINKGGVMIIYDVKKALEVLSAQTGSPMGIVNEIFLKREFVESDVKVKKTGAILGRLEDYEIAEFSAMDAVYRKKVDLMKQKPTLYAITNNKKPALEKYYDDLCKLETVFTVISFNFWCGVRQRLNAEDEALGIRKDWIVQVLTRKEINQQHYNEIIAPECPDCPFKYFDIKTDIPPQFK
jgi:hypothetical protein